MSAGSTPTDGGAAPELPKRRPLTSIHDRVDALADRWEAEVGATTPGDPLRVIAASVTASCAAELRAAIDVEAGPQPPADGLPRFTITRGELVRAMAPVWPIAELPDLADLAGAILGNLDGAPPALPLPVLPLSGLVPDHECSFLLNDPQGLCKHGCGKTWARNVAEQNLHAALEAYAATEPAPPHDGMWPVHLPSMVWDDPSVSRLDSAVMAHPRAQDGHAAASGPGLVPADTPPGTEAGKIDLRAAPDDPWIPEGARWDS